MKLIHARYSGKILSVLVTCSEIIESIFRNTARDYIHRLISHDNKTKNHSEGKGKHINGLEGFF